MGSGHEMRWGGLADQILLGAVFFTAAVALLLWFGAALATAFRRADPDSDAPAVVLAGYAVVCAIGFFAIRILPGQIPENFVAHAPAIAYDLGVTEVRVVPLERFLIRLDLLP